VAAISLPSSPPSSPPSLRLSSPWLSSRPPSLPWPLGDPLCRLLGHHLLGGLLAEPPARRLAGFFDQPGGFLKRQRGRLDVLGDLGVELAVADVRTIAPIEHLDVAAVPLADDAVAGDLLLLLDQLHRPVETDGVGIIFLGEGGIGAATLGEGAEAPDADRHRLAVVLAQRARHLEQLQRLLEGDRVDALAGLQGGELRLLLVLHRAHLDQRAVLADARADGAAAGGVVSAR